MVPVHSESTSVEVAPQMIHALLVPLVLVLPDVRPFYSPLTSLGPMLRLLASDFHEFQRKPRPGPGPPAQPPDGSMVLDAEGHPLHPMQISPHLWVLRGNWNAPGQNPSPTFDTCDHLWEVPRTKHQRLARFLVQVIPLVALCLRTHGPMIALNA